MSLFEKLKFAWKKFSRPLLRYYQEIKKKLDDGIFTRWEIIVIKIFFNSYRLQLLISQKFKARFLFEKLKFIQKKVF